MLTIWVLGLAGFVRRGWCQTPVDFQPSSEAKLGIKYTNIEITPPGTVVQTLDRKWALSRYWSSRTCFSLYYSCIISPNR